MLKKRKKFKAKTDFIKDNCNSEVSIGTKLRGGLHGSCSSFIIIIYLKRKCFKNY